MSNQIIFIALFYLFYYTYTDADTGESVGLHIKRIGEYLDGAGIEHWQYIHNSCTPNWLFLEIISIQD